MNAMEVSRLCALPSKAGILPCRSRVVVARRRSAGELVRFEAHSLEVSPRAAPPMSKATSSMDLLVVGPGVLGRLVARRWLEGNAGCCRVVGQTKSEIHHEELKQLDILPVVRNPEIASERFPCVIFCAPPYGNEDYPGEVRLAVQRWNGNGSLLFTSSSSVYDCIDNGVCDELTPAVEPGRNPRTDMLLQAEREVLEAGGNVVRLAGLYTRDRGAHTFWLKAGSSNLRPDHLVNLIHYEDAADLCEKILKSSYRGRIFMGCDGHPLSRQEIMDATSRSGKFESTFSGFSGTGGPLGKRMENRKTRAELSWAPRYSSFVDFICN